MSESKLCKHPKGPINICFECINNKLNQRDKLLEFVKELAFLDRYTDDEINEFNKIGYYFEVKEIRDFLKEIREL